MINAERQRHWATAALVFCAMCGPGLGYGPVYLFHLVLATCWVWLLFTDGASGIIAELHRSRGTLLFVGLSLAWWCASLLWTPDLREGLLAVIYWSLGFALILALLLLIKDGPLLRTALHSACAAIVIEVVVAVLEVLTPLRWPISRLAEHAALFGRPSDVAALLVEEGSADYLASSPTGFHWNENDLAALVLLVLPFFFMARRWWVWLVATGLTGWIIVSSGARLGWAGLLVAMVAVLLVWKGRRWLACTVICVMVLVSTNGFSPRYHAWKKVRETQVFSRMMVGADLDTVQLRTLGDLGLTDGSAGARKELFRLGLRAVSEHPLVGLGAGGSRSYIRAHWPIERRPVSDLHCWWLQVAVEGGSFMLVLHLAWWGGIVRTLFTTMRRASGEARDQLMAALVAMVVLVPVGVMPSSMIYFLPIHLLAAMAISLSRYSPIDAHAPSR